MFMEEVAEDLNKIVCRYFAVAPEFDPKDYPHMNTGVMLINVKNLIAVDEKFRKFVISNLEKFPCCDQSAYQCFIEGREKDFCINMGGIGCRSNITGDLTGRLFKRKDNPFPWPGAVSHSSDPLKSSST